MSDDRPRWKKMRPRDARGLLDSNMRENDARRENAAIRKRLVRRKRRLEKADFGRMVRDLA